MRGSTCTEIAAAADATQKNAMLVVHTNSAERGKGADRASRDLRQRNVDFGSRSIVIHKTEVERRTATRFGMQLPAAGVGLRR